jgi:uncharacterized integral membrane protein
MGPKGVAIFVIIILLLVILFQNLGIVQIHLLFWTIHMSLLLVILLPFIFGLITGWLVNSLMRRRKVKSTGA